MSLLGGKICIYIDPSNYLMSWWQTSKFNSLLNWTAFPHCVLSGSFDLYKRNGGVWSLFFIKLTSHGAISFYENCKSIGNFSKHTTTVKAICYEPFWKARSLCGTCHYSYLGNNLACLVYNSCGLHKGQPWCEVKTAINTI